MSNFSQLGTYVTSHRSALMAATRYASVSRSVGLLIEAQGLHASLGSICWLARGDSEIPCEVVGFAENKAFLMPLAAIDGVQPGSLIRVPHQASQVDLLPNPDQLLGRVVNGLCEPIDGGPSFSSGRSKFEARSINPMHRKPIDTQLDVGVGTINSMLSVGVGQRLGLFAGSGVGKSVMMGMLARFVKADVVVVGLIGERGREVQEFVIDNLGAGLQRAVVVACPADDSAALRLRGARLATQIAEVYRDQGKSVLLLMDSLTRVAQAQREIGLAMGEPPTSKGYTPSSFAWLPRLVERAGCGENADSGAITGFYTVLMEEDDLQDPIVDAARAILDGHIVLSRSLAEQGLYPAIDIGSSVSRLMTRLTNSDQQGYAQRFRALWQCYREQQDLINIGAYRPGSDALTDEAIGRHDAMVEFLRQGEADAVSIDESNARLKQVFAKPLASSATENNFAMINNG
ncbi:MAG: FliI/YscN family ATPase [Pseudomonadaceae bacterium]|nr:FliI/YscN family ATPase [Pseudomonadaceae bacterium]